MGRHCVNGSAAQDQSLQACAESVPRSPRAPAAGCESSDLGGPENNPSISARK